MESYIPAISIIISSLATYGVSSLLTNYEGFHGIFSKLRDKYPDSFLQCLVCTSVIVSIFICFMSGVGILGWLAVIGIIILVEQKL